MAKYSYGINSFMYGDIDPTSGDMLNGVEIKEAIYRDSFNVTEEEGTTTDHYSEMDSTPKVSFTEVGKETLTFQIMDTDTDMLVRFLGGSVDSSGARDIWEKPSGAQNIEKSIKVVTSDGTDLEYPRVKITGRRNFQLRRTGIWVIDVTATVLTPTLPAGTPKAAVIITDPA